MSKSNIHMMIISCVYTVCTIANLVNNSKFYQIVVKL